MIDPRRCVLLIALGVAACSSAGSPTTLPTATTAASETTDPTTTIGAVPTSATTTATASTDAPTTPPPAPTTTQPDPPPSTAALTGLALRLEPVADVLEPTGMAWRADDPGMYITAQRGTVVRVADGAPTIVIDLSAETTIIEPGSERGLLGIAFDPRDGRMFLNFTGRDNNTRVVSFEVVDGVALPESRRDVLFIEQPGVGHNGGRLVFDGEGHLFIGMGDGGGSNGRDAQDGTKLLGAILRVLPRLDGDGYDIPPDNPFVGRTDERAEVWARGFRNPWMFSIDGPTGDMWIGDVGNSEIEEIDVIRAGQKGLNFGWYYFEGSKQRYGSVPAGMTPPVHEYPHTVGNAVMGGYVYRGSAIPALRGAYVFGDVNGKVWALAADGVVPLAVDDVGFLLGWGTDPNGELYLFSMNDGVLRLAPA